jgi:hypothetical protein
MIRTLPIFLLAAMLLTACAAAPQAPPATSASAPSPAVTAATAAPTLAPALTQAPTDDQIKAGIQQTIDLYARAYNDNDATLLQQAVDQSNAPFRRLVQGTFDRYQQSFLAGQEQRSYTITSITPRERGYIMGRIENQNGLIADWTFRQIDDKWLLSEPTEEQIGKRETIEGGHFVFYSYPWAAGDTTALMKLMERARDRALERLGKVPDHKLSVYVKPVFGIGSPENPNVAAYCDCLGKAKNSRMIIFAPHSYQFGFYDPGAGWEPKLENILTHEYTHFVNDTMFTPMARMADWMYEGIAEYVADNPRAGEVHAAVRADHWIPLVDTSGRIQKQDLEHIYILEADRSLAYGFAYSLVEYISVTYGGLEGWWKFVGAFDEAQNLDKALRSAFGVGYAQFEQDWRAWLRQKYG